MKRRGKKKSQARKEGKNKNIIMNLTAIFLSLPSINRLELTSELLHHIRTIKMYAWESPFLREIFTTRGEEVAYLKIRKYLDALCVYFWATTPVLVSLSTFSMYSLRGGELTASVVFTSLSLFNILIHPLNAFPWVINGLVEARISIIRIRDFLLADEVKPLSSSSSSSSLSPPSASYNHTAANTTSHFSTIGLYSSSTSGEGQPRSNIHDKVLKERGRENERGGSTRGTLIFRDVNLAYVKPRVLQNLTVFDDKEALTAQWLSSLGMDPLDLGPSSVGREREREREGDRERRRGSEYERERDKESDGFGERDIGYESFSSYSRVPLLAAHSDSDDDYHSHLTPTSSKRQHGHSHPSTSHTSSRKQSKGKKGGRKREKKEDEKSESERNREREEKRERDAKEEEEERERHPFVLRDLNIVILPGMCVGVSGPVGSGKSLFLNSILGESGFISGDINISGSVSYVGQRSWTENTSLRENILFGSPFNEEKYKATLFACALVDDLKQFPGGDLTEIGERGVNLSGGQNARLSLARAVYQDCDIILLDDPFSSVDGPVARHIMKYCVFGLLRHKTRIVVTHHTYLLEDVDVLIEMDTKGGVSTKQLITDWTSPTLIDEKEKEEENENEKEKERKGEKESESESGGENGKEKEKERERKTWELPEEARSIIIGDVRSEEEREREKERKKPSNEIKSVEEREREKLADGVEVNTVVRLVAEEERESGTISMSVVWSYIRAIGIGLSLFIIFSLLLMQGSRNASDLWLTSWVEEREDERERGDGDSENEDSYFLEIFAVIALLNSIFTLVRAFSFAYGGLRAAVSLFHSLLGGVVLSPASFFDQNPVGRLLNRFSSDTYAIDEQIPFQSNVFLALVFSLIGSLTVVTITIPYFLLLIPPLSILYYYTQRYYRATSRELRRLDSVSCSPIYSHFDMTLDGLIYIRSLKAQSRFESMNMSLLHDNQCVSYSSLTASQWLSIRLQGIGICMVTFISFFAVAMNASSRSSIKPALVGLSLAYTLPITASLNGLIGRFTETEKEIVSVERVLEYADSPPEEKGSTLEDVALTDRNTAQIRATDTVSALRLERKRKSSATDTPSKRERERERERAELDNGINTVWPSRGNIVFEDVSLIYRSGLKPALDHVSLNIPAGSRVGIVGRTGAGKSSLLQLLFRMRDITSGRILIDDIDTSSLSKRSVRASLCIIPQEAVIFSGSVRRNLDPMNDHPDYDLEMALEQCGLLDFVMDLPEGLDTNIHDEHIQLSVGEKQLICLCRALLNKTKVLCLDEATALVDHSTDQHIQEVIQNAFSSCTVITIAHRLETTRSCDIVVVMDSGRVVEVGSPASLLDDPDSFYTAMCAPNQLNMMKEE